MDINLNLIKIVKDVAEFESSSLCKIYYFHTEGLLKDYMNLIEKFEKVHIDNCDKFFNSMSHDQYMNYIKESLIWFANEGLTSFHEFITNINHETRKELSKDMKEYINRNKEALH